MKIRLHSLAHPVTALGPGRRIALWTAGCERRCPGCISPEMSSPESGRLVSVDRLAEKLFSLSGDFDGITISGGEPMDQAEPLTALAKCLQTERPAWSIILYTGYILDEIKKIDGGARLLKQIDALIDGPYKQNRPPREAVAGSGNQTVHCLSARGRQMEAALKAPPTGRFDLGFSKNGEARLIGAASANQRKKTHQALCLKR